MLNSIKTLKKYCKATLNVFFDKKKLDDDQKITHGIDFSYQNKILLLKM